jgi:hypothetical protein
LTYRSLWHAAEQLRVNGEKDDDNGFWSLLAATLFVFIAYEGFLNDLGERVAPDIWVGEREFFSKRTFVGTLGKTRFLAQRIGLALDRVGRPYSTLAELSGWRNGLVHPRTVRVHGTRRIAGNHRPPTARPMAFALIERPSFVARSFEDIAAIADKLLSAASQDYDSQVRDLGSSAFVGHLGITSASLLPEVTD